MAQVVDNTPCKPLKATLCPWGHLGKITHRRADGTVFVVVFFVKGKKVYRLLAIIKESDNSFVDLEHITRNAVLDTVPDHPPRPRKDMQRCLEAVRWACDQYHAFDVQSPEEAFLVDVETKRVFELLQRDRFNELTRAIRKSM